MMTKDEFEKRIKENITSDNIHDLIEYRWPVVEYYVKYIANKHVLFSINNQVTQIHTSQIVMNKPNADNDEQFCLINIAFDHIKKTFIK
jgi:hypothetical protein